MRRVRIDRPGGHRQLRLEEVPDPKPGPDELRIAVVAAGVNFADCAVRMGLYASAKKYVGWPITPGFEVSGHVDAVGPGVDPAWIGRPCWAVTRFGGYASAVVVPQDHCFVAPPGIDLIPLAGAPVVYFTAIHAALHLAAVAPGHTVLIHSAAGGVGGALARLCHREGATVIGLVSSPTKVPHATASGCAEVHLTTGTPDLWSRLAAAHPEGFHAIFDAVGGPGLRHGYLALRPTGRLITYGFAGMLRRGGDGRPDYLKLAWTYLRTPRFNPLDMTGDNKSVLGFNLSYLFDRHDLLAQGAATLQSGLTDGSLPPLPVHPFPIDHVADAHRALESGTTTGKLVLTFP